MFIRLSRGKSVSLVSLIPNLLTTAALCSALASVHFSLREDWPKALFAIFLSALFDTLDGRAARLLRVSSGFGAVLDSLSDFVAFGVAPAIILHQWIFHLDDPSLRMRDDPYALLNLIAVIVFPLCAGLRLARFTAAVPAGKTPVAAGQAVVGQTVTVPSPSAANYFTGMPTPAAAGAALVPAMLEASKMVNIKISPTATAVYVLVIALLMISRVPMFSFKKLRVSRMWVAPLLVAAGVFVILMWRDVWSTLSVIALAYLASAPLSLYMRRKARRAELAAAGLSEEPE